MKLKTTSIVILSVSIVLLGVIITSALGLFKTESTKVPKRLEEATANGAYDPADIKGSYSFAEISRLFDIPINDLADAFGVEKNAAATFKCKDLETVFGESDYDIGTSSVRLFVAYYLGLPYETNEESYLTQTAAQILEVKGAMTDTETAYLKSHTVPVG